MKHIIPLFLALLLTACGGGGGSGASQSPIADSGTIIGLVSNSTGIGFSSRLTTGTFDLSGGKYVVVSGIYLGPDNFGPLPNPDGPLRIYKLNQNGTGSDVSANIIGEGVTIPGSALVADFNGDGIDDIVSLYLKDYPSGPGNGSNSFSGNGAVFLSQPGQLHSRSVLAGVSWSHGQVVADIDGDGDLDIVNSEGKKWVNDSHGNFTFQDHSWNTNTSNGLWMNGSSVCAGDFNNTGRPQLVITDLMTGGVSATDTVIFELDQQLIPTTAHVLPVPVLDRFTNIADNEISHDMACKVADLNNDGLLDILVFSRPWDYARNGQWTDEGTVQVLINQGNWQFTDVTISSLINAAVPVYYPVVADFNNDGGVDLWDGVSSIYINGGSNVFAQSVTTFVKPSSGISAVPVLLDNKWDFVTVESNSSNLVVRFKKLGLTF